MEEFFENYVETQEFRHKLQHILKKLLKLQQTPQVIFNEYFLSSINEFLRLFTHFYFYVTKTTRNELEAYSRVNKKSILIDDDTDDAIYKKIDWFRSRQNRKLSKQRKTTNDATLRNKNIFCYFSRPYFKSKQKTIGVKKTLHIGSRDFSENRT